MKAIHNNDWAAQQYKIIVSNMSKILNESNSQHTIEGFVTEVDCFQYVKDTK